MVKEPLTSPAPNQTLTVQPTNNQAHRVITQVFVTGARVFGRALSEAYQHASATSKYQSAVGGTAAGSNTASSAGLTLDEACKILDVGPPKAGHANMDHVVSRFKRLFDQNNPKRGGSFYLQSKVLRARERIELEVRQATLAAERDQELRHGWQPKLYRDR